MDIVVDSVSVATTFKKSLEKGIIFMSISDAIKEHPLVSNVLGDMIPQKIILCCFKFSIL
jgi:Fe-S cluster assembly protein SufB